MADVQNSQHEHPAQRPLQAKCFRKVEADWRDTSQAEPRCSFIINSLWLIVREFFQLCGPLPQHHPQPILATSEMDGHSLISCVHTGSSGETGIPDWNEEWMDTKGALARTRLAIICHTNPHDVRPRSDKQAGTAGRKDWGIPAANGQPLIRRVISVTKVTHTIRPRQLASACGCGHKWWLAYSWLTLPSKMGKNLYFWPCQPHNMRSRSEKYVLLLCLTKAHEGSSQRQTETNSETEQAEWGRGSADKA